MLVLVVVVVRLMVVIMNVTFGKQGLLMLLLWSLLLVHLISLQAGGDAHKY